MLRIGEMTAVQAVGLTPGVEYEIVASHSAFEAVAIRLAIQESSRQGTASAKEKNDFRLRFRYGITL